MSTALGNGLHCWLISGCRMRLLRTLRASDGGAEFLDFRPTLFFGVPTIYVRLLESPAERRRAKSAAFMRLFVSGSAPLPAQVLEEFRAALRPHDSGALRHERNADEHQQSLCRASGGREAWACRLPGVDCDSGCIETAKFICKRTECLRRILAARRSHARRLSSMAGSGPAIWRPSPPTAITRCAGRKSDLIISGGFNIYPREIEEFLQEQPEIVGSGRGRRGRIRVRGEVPVAYVVCAAEVDCQRTRGRAAARNSRRSRSRANSSRWKSCRATRWAKCRSICCRRQPRLLPAEAEGHGNQDPCLRARV